MANEKGPEMRRTKQNKKMSYEKKLTLSVEIEGNDKTTMELLRKVKECGEVIGFRHKNPKSYELTMRSEEGKAKLMDGLRIQNTVTASEINKDEIVVSFINLPIYIGD